jgi:ketosteroid isomerase-like protein
MHRRPNAVHQYTRTQEVHMTTEPTSQTAEDQLRALIAHRVEAVRAKDVDQAMAVVAPDILSFDVVNALQFSGWEASKARTEAWFSSFQGPIGFEVRDLQVHAGDEVAFSHSLNRYSGVQTGPVEIDMWVRATTCYRRIDGNWMVTHEHQSVPFDGESGRASLDLSP